MRWILTSSIPVFIATCIGNFQAMGQQCQACQCESGQGTHPVYTIQECIQGCSTLELVCSSEEHPIFGVSASGVSRTIIGRRFSVKPFVVSKDCTTQIILDGGQLIGPSSGCPTGQHGPPPMNRCHGGATAYLC
jgi:hypothetical protein